MSEFSWMYERGKKEGSVLSWHLVRVSGQDKKGWNTYELLCGEQVKANKLVTGSPHVQNDWDKCCMDCINDAVDPKAAEAREKAKEWEEKQPLPNLPNLTAPAQKAEPKKKAKGPRMPEVLFEGTEQLPVKLTEDELLDYGQQLAQAESEVRAHNEHATSVKAGLKHREAELTAQQSRLASIIRAKSELREVPVRTEADYRKGTATTIRLDTFNAVRERSLTQVERQGSLGLDSLANTPDEDEAA